MSTGLAQALEGPWRTGQVDRRGHQLIDTGYAALPEAAQTPPDVISIEAGFTAEAASAAEPAAAAKAPVISTHANTAPAIRLLAKPALFIRLPPSPGVPFAE